MKGKKENKQKELIQSKKEKIFEQAKTEIVKHNLIFIEDLVAFVPIGKTTFYEYFPIDSNEMNELKELIDSNKINLKVKMRNNWFESTAPALQMALMKLIATPDELKRLSVNYIDHTTEGKEIKVPAFVWGKNEEKE
jgi:hypothetical protein